jgi:hypothetical protein
MHGAIPPLPQYVMAWSLVKHGDNFTLPLPRKWKVPTQDNAVQYRRTYFDAPTGIGTHDINVRALNRLAT